MKKILFTVFAVLLLGGVWSCSDDKDDTVTKTVDLRYRADDVYNLSATGAQAFTILVASTDPWTVESEHPDWCIISEEDGAGSDPDLVRVGKAPATTIRIQYYDNTYLDDRTDHITIKSDYWTGKVITVNQKGIAFLSVSEDDLDQEVAKAGGEYTIHVSSNQDWSSRVTDGDWISITDGSTGNGVGVISVAAVENFTELRYSQVTVYDRHDVPMAYIQFTQDGVQLVPASTELRAGFDQEYTEIEVTSNTKWMVEKSSDTDDWFTIETPTGEGNGTIRLALTNNDGTSMRKSSVILKNVVASADEYQAEKEIVVKQAYQITPVRHILDNDELSLWKSDWVNAPVYTKDVGTLFTAKARLNRSMPFGTYTFRWSALTPGARVRHWFCFPDGIELKADIRPASSKVSFDFNGSSSGVSTKPSISEFTDLDFSQPVEFTYKFDPQGAEYCHVTYLVNGVVAGSFDTSASVLHTVLWGASINMYIGCDEEGEGSSAICEWYEYTAPMNWNE